MIRPATARALRRLLLASARRVPPDLARRRGHEGALLAVREAVRVSPAYRQLLKEHGLSAGRLAKGFELRDLPVLTKDNTFGRFTLDQLARPSRPEDLADVLTSSGRSGGHFGFKLSDRHEHDNAWFGIDLGLQDAFNVDTQPTLLVNCLPMGVMFRSRAVTVANVSVREDMACAILRDVGPRFRQTIVCTDPLFVRRLIDHARDTGVDWRRLNTSMIVGEEMLVEAQRDYIGARLGIDLDADPHRAVASSFGVGELGLNLLFESRETIRIRRAARRLPELAAQIDAGAVSLPSIFCHVPRRVHVEVLNPDRDGWGLLCFTMLDRRALVPLPRFTTGDVGRLFDGPQTERAARLAGTAPPWLPLVLVRGRAADRATGEASVEAVKEWLYGDHADADLLTGAFRLGAGAEGNTKVLLQARSPAPPATDHLARRLEARARAVGLALAVEIVAAHDFPYRPWLDYERKFAYRASPAA